LACQDEFFFVNIPHDFNENDEHALDFALNLFSASVSLDFPCTVHAFLPKRLSNRCQSLCHTSS
jgi:hypothetical protein